MKPNNPKIFADIVSLDIWRDPYSSIDGSSKLYVDAVFTVGSITGKSNSGEKILNFSLSLRRAELLIKKDKEDIIKIPKSGISYNNLNFRR